MRRSVILVLIALFICSCSNIKIINEAEIYSKDFLAQIVGIQLIYRDGDKHTALKKLESISDVNLRKSEIAKKYNFIGVIFFSQGSLDQAIENFQIAKQNVGADYYLGAQINLNLSSAYYKSSKIELAGNILNSIDLDYFSDKEKEKYHKLNFAVSAELENSKGVVISLLYLMRKLETFSEVEQYQYKDLMVDNFKKLSSSERVHLLDQHYKESRFAIAYLARIEATDRYYIGDKSGAEDVLSWLDQKFGNMEGVEGFISDFNGRIENYSTLSLNSVGVVLPLTERKGKFGKKIITGMSTALANLKKSTVKLYVKDNKNNVFLAKKMIEELVLKHHVSVIIGGLFPDLAIEEYLEAKKYGVYFISLSPVYLPKNQKNHLLLEVSGSVESQISKLMNEEFLGEFGKNISVFYPKTDKGMSYVDSLWKLSEEGVVNLKGIFGYEKGVKEYLMPVKTILGLKNSRERKEEYKIWKDIYSVNKRHVRIVNYLKPILDFDWMFIPAYPQEALQIIPTFNYYDAKRVIFVGDQSWLNKKLVKERKNLGQMLFVGNDPSKINRDFVTNYYKVNKKKPHYLESLGYESINLIHQVLGEQELSKRDELEGRIKQLGKLVGVTSDWNMINGLWIKDMDILKISRKGITKWIPKPKEAEEINAI